ncbi:hypothetical protein BS78_10G063700 [Paspalum vaginatum]|nr:hypothetical protein BS78_10G063700 [Paspalum vaginatum]
MYGRKVFAWLLIVVFLTARFRCAPNLLRHAHYSSSWLEDWEEGMAMMGRRRRRYPGRRRQGLRQPRTEGRTLATGGSGDEDDAAAAGAVEQDEV